MEDLNLWYNYKVPSWARIFKQYDQISGVTKLGKYLNRQCFLLPHSELLLAEFLNRFQVIESSIFKANS